MKIVLCNLSGVKDEPRGSLRHFAKGGSRWPMTTGYTKSVDYYPFPFYLAYATAILKKEFPDFDIKGIDGVANDYTEDELYEEISRNPPDILVAEVTLLRIKDDLSFLQKIKESLGSYIIITGVYPCVFKGTALEDNSFIDFAIYGEYELSLLELIHSLKSSNLKSIEGLIYRDGTEISIHPQKASIANLDILPFPDRIDFSPSRYADFSFYWPSISIIASRGCPVGCIYCVEQHIIYNSFKHRTRDYKSVVDEMEFCIKMYKARQFYFDDQSLLVNEKFAQDLCAEIIKRKLNIPWTCMGDAMFGDCQTLQKMSDAGCIGVKFGVESANSTILKNIKKPLNLDKVIKFVACCKKLGMITHATCCIGLPGETEETIKETLSFIDSLDVDTAQVSKAIPYPGTPFFQWAQENKYLVTQELDLYDGSAKSVLSYPALSAERIDYWYEIFSRKFAKRKLGLYLKRPTNSFIMLYDLYRCKGFIKTLQSLFTFIGRCFSWHG